MLSDKFLKGDECSYNENLTKQIQRLEELSVSMTNLIDNGNPEKIVHLEKVRQKILKDIIKQKNPIDENLQPQISNIINLNKKMIEKMHDTRASRLGIIKKKIKFYKSYRDI